MKQFTKLFLSIASVLLSMAMYAQNKQVSGVVVADDDNTPMNGVTVAVKGTKTVTKTNAAGYYAIDAAAGQVLVFTFIDHVRQLKVVGTETSLNIRLVQNSKQLGEVIVTAQGIRKNKREIPYQAQSLQGEEIASTQRENWINSLAGRVAGANITSTSGTPGASTSIVLRGAVSIGGNNQPLFVVDGIPFDNQTMNQENLASGNSVSLGNRNNDYGNRAMDINPDDIESVTILKGPEASALYGSDGASGAIIITTKKGKAGKASVSYDNAFRFEKLYRFPEVQKTYSRGLNGIADPNAVVNPFAAGNQFAYFGPKYAPNTQFYDNFNAFFQTGFTQRHNISVDGGSDISTYRLSMNYVNQGGVVPNTAFERLTAKLTGTAKLSKRVNLTTSLAYNSNITDKANKGAGAYLLNLLNFPQDVDARDYLNTDGSRKLFRSTSTSLVAEFDNPFWDVNKNRSQDKLDRLTANVGLSIDAAKWLNFTVNSGLDYYSQTGDLLIHPQSRFGFNTNGFYSLYSQTTKNQSNVVKVTAKKKFGQFTNTLTVGFANDDNKTRVDAQRGERFYEINYKSINNTDPLSRDAKTTVLNTRKTRLFANYILGYNNLLYASFAGNREGSSTFMSRFVDKDPYYNYGSASLSFVFSDLKVFDALPWLNYGKARISYGTTGKGPITPYIIDYTFQSQITTGGGYAYGFTGNNVDLRPEITENLEYGAELKLFKNRLSIDVTRYELRSRDQILAARASYGTGYVIKYFNGGLVENKGVEAIINAKMVTQKNFTWDLTANFDLNRGRIVKMPADLPTYYDSDTWVFGNMRSQAYAGAFTGNLSTFSVAKSTDGKVLISPTTGLPFSNGDFAIAGDRQPDFRLGLTNSFTYKDFSLSFLLDFRRGGDVFNGNEYFLFLTGLSTKTLDREKPVVINGVLNDGLQNTSNPTSNNITVYPYYRSDYFGTSVATEADFIETVNWIRLRDATLSYNLPKKWLKKTKFISRANVFVTGTDLFIITNYSGADPSVNTNSAFARGYGGAGIDYGVVSTPRGVNFGCKFQF